MYPTSGSTIRGDLNTVIEEASMADEGLIGTYVMPPMARDKKAGTYAKLTIAGGALMDAVATERAVNGSYGEISRQWGSDNYDCVDRGLKERVDDADAADVARFFDAEATAARLVKRNVLLAHERRVAAAIFNTANFTATNSAVAYTLANSATLSFVTDVLDAIERCADNGVNANTIVLSSTLMSRLKRTTLVKEWIRGTVDGNVVRPINAANLAASFADEGITQVLIGRARYNSGKKGAAYTAARIWGTDYVWVGYVNPTATDVKLGGAGFTFYWNAEGGLWVTETYRDDDRRSNMVRVRQNTTEKVTDPTAGALITTQWA